MKCILCGSRKNTEVFSVSKAPANIQGLLTKGELKNDSSAPLKLIHCSDCGMVQLHEDSYPEDGYYDDYLMGTSFLEKHQRYNSWFVKILLEKYDLNGKVVLDVGCGDGYFVEIMNRAGIHGFGIEPSRRFFLEAKRRGIKVLNEYLDENSEIHKNSLDAFVSRQVFEHLRNPRQVLSSLNLFLKPGGIGVIEVPSFEKTMRDERYYDVFRDHVAYYTRESLRKLVEMSGYELITIDDAFDFEYLVAVFRKKYDTSVFSLTFEANKKHFAETFLGLAGKKVVVWGAGGKGNAMLPMYGITSRDVIAVLDSDPNKIGKYTVGSHLRIASPEFLRTNEVDVIIISAIAYKDEIIGMIRNKYKFKGDIYLIAPRLAKV